MVQTVYELSKKIEGCISSFWEGITTVEQDKLIIDGDNILMLYLYVLVRAGVRPLFAYMKFMEEFSTPFVSCQSKYGYCMSTIKVAMDRINHSTVRELVANQHAMTAE